MDVGDYKLVIDKKDGSARKYETIVANLTPIMKWVGEQREAIQKSAAEREQKKQQQQLPPGYVEVTPGYQPPPGFVAVPVDQVPPPPPQQPALPQAPAQMFEQPLPAEGQQPQPQRRTWAAPGGGN
jgi:hypothetical protein